MDASEIKSLMSGNYCTNMLLCLITGLVVVVVVVVVFSVIQPSVQRPIIATGKTDEQICTSPGVNMKRQIGINRLI